MQRQDVTLYAGLTKQQYSTVRNFESYPDFEAGTTGWGTYGSSTMAAAPNQGLWPNVSGNAIKSLSTLAEVSGIYGTVMYLTPGMRYTYSAWAKLATSAPVTLAGYTTTGGYGPSVVLTDDWQLITNTFTYTPPAGSPWVNLGFAFTSTAAGQGFLLDGVVCVEGTVPAPTYYPFGVNDTSTYPGTVGLWLDNDLDHDEQVDIWLHGQPVNRRERVNLIPDPGLTGPLLWRESVANTLSISTTTLSPGGYNSLKVDIAAGGNSIFVAYGTATGDRRRRFYIGENQPFTATARVKVDPGSATPSSPVYAFLGFNYYDGTDTIITNFNADYISIDSSGWATLSYTGVTPAGTTWMTYSVQSTLYFPGTATIYVAEPYLALASDTNTFVVNGGFGSQQVNDVLLWVGGGFTPSTLPPSSGNTVTGSVLSDLTPRTNLCTDPSMKTGAPWASAHSSWSNWTSLPAALFGDSNMRVWLSNAIPDTNVANYLCTFPSAGTYTVSLYARNGAGSTMPPGTSLTLSAEGGTAVVSAPTNKIDGVLGSDYTRTSATFTVTTPGTAYLVWRLSIPMSSIGVFAQVFLDGCLIEAGSTLQPYFDGGEVDGFSYSSLGWNGTADASTSTVTPVLAITPVATATAGPVVHTTSAVPVVVNPVPQEVCTNRDFESDIIGWDSTWPAAITWDSTQSHGGTHSMKVECVDNSIDEYGAEFTIIGTTASPRITATAWVKGGIGTSQTLTFFSYDTYTDVHVTGTGSWQQISIDITGPLGNGAYPIRIIQSGPCAIGDTFYIDDVSILDYSAVIYPAAAGAVASGPAVASPTTITPTSTAAAGAITRSTTAGAVTVAPITTAAAGAITKTQTATGITVAPTVTAVPTLMTKTIDAPSITVSPTVTSVPSAMTKTQAATGTTVSPATTATSTVTKFGDAPVTVAPTTTVVPSPIADQATADIAVSPAVTAVPAAMTKTQAATGVTVAPATAAAGAVTHTAAVAVTVTPSPTADGARAITASAVTTLVDVISSYEHIANGTFETNTTGWSGYNSEALTRDTSQFHSGAASLHVVNTTFGGISNAPSYRLTIHDFYNSLDVSAWVKADQVTSTDSIYLQVTQIGGNGQGTRQALTLPGFAHWSDIGSGWYHMTWHVPNFGFADTMVYDLQVIATTSNGGDGFWLDDVSVVEPLYPVIGGLYVSVLSTREALATSSLTITPSTTADGTRTAGAVTQTASASLTVTPTTTATPNQLTKSIDAPGVTVSPATTATRSTASITGTGAQTVVTPTMSVVPSPISDFASADLLVSPIATSIPAAIVKTASADVVVTPTTSVVPSAIVDTATADDAVTPTTSAAGTTTHLATTALTITPTSLADGTAAKSSNATDTVVPVTTGTPATAVKTSTASITDAPTTSAIPLPLTKSTSANATLGGGGSLHLVDPAVTLPVVIWSDAGMNDADGSQAFVFDTTVIPAEATITSWSVTAIVDATGTNTAFMRWANAELGLQALPGSATTGAAAVVAWTTQPVAWRLPNLTYTLWNVNGDLYLFEQVTVTAVTLDIVYTMAGVTSTATLGPKTITGTAALTVSPTPLATGVTTGIGAGSAFLTITPSTTGTLGAVTKTTDATVTISPASAAAGTVAKATTATAVSISPASTAAGFITQTATASITVTPSTTAAYSAAATTATATPVTVSPAPLASPAAASKQGDAALVITPTVVAAGTVSKPQAALDTTVGPTASATLGAVTKSTTATDTVAPTTSVVPNPITDTASVTVTVSPAATAVALPITDTSPANLTITPTSTATAGVMTKTTSVSVTQVTPITAGISGTSATNSLTVTPATAASGAVTRMGTASVTVTPTPTAAGYRELMAAALAFTVSLTTSAASSKTAFGSTTALVTALSAASAVYSAVGQAHTTITPVPLAKVGADWAATAALVIAAASQADARTRRPERWGTLRI